MVKANLSALIAVVGITKFEKKKSQLESRVKYTLHVLPAWYQIPKFPIAVSLFLLRAPGLIVHELQMP